MLYFISEETDKDHDILLINKNIIQDQNKDKDNDFVVIDLDYKDDNILLKDIDKNKICEFTTIFNYHKYLEDILKTYDHKWDNIYEQFKVDFNRCKFFINNVQFTDIDMFIEKGAIYDVTIGSLAIMLFNQSTFGWPMEKIIKFHSIIDNYILKDAEGCYIYLNIIIDKEKKNKKIEIYKRLKIAEFMYNEKGLFLDIVDKYNVDINLYFTFENINNCIELKKIHKYVQDTSLMTWKIIKI